MLCRFLSLQKFKLLDLNYKFPIIAQIVQMSRAWRLIFEKLCCCEDVLLLGSSMCVPSRLGVKHRIATLRMYSNLPDATVYGGPKAQTPSKRVTLRHLASKYIKKEPITMVTAYDYPSAVHVDQAGIDICLVGDSVGE